MGEMISIATERLPIFMPFFQRLARDWRADVYTDSRRLVRFNLCDHPEWKAKDHALFDAESLTIIYRVKEEK